MSVTPCCGELTPSSEMLKKWVKKPRNERDRVVGTSLVLTVVQVKKTVQEIRKRGQNSQQVGSGGWGGKRVERAYIAYDR